MIVSLLIILNFEKKGESNNFLNQRLICCNSCASNEIKKEFNDLFLSFL